MAKARDFHEFINLESSFRSRSKMDDILLGMDSGRNGTSPIKPSTIKTTTIGRIAKFLMKWLKAEFRPFMLELDRDQDGRDTLLGYQHLTKHSVAKDKHFLVIHKAGHGCGDAFKLSQWHKMVRMTDTTPVNTSLEGEDHITHYMQKPGQLRQWQQFFTITTTNKSVSGRRKFHSEGVPVSEKQGP